MRIAFDPREVLQTLRPEEWERQNEAMGLLFAVHSIERNATDLHRELSRLPLTFQREI